jgi:hypothetical protein
MLSCDKGIRNSVPSIVQTSWRDAIPFWALVAFIMLTFLTGGAARGDVQSLVILRPAAVVFCAIGLWSLSWAEVRAYKFLFSLAAAVFALVALHLIPLPPSIWGALPGRAFIVEIDKGAELGLVWRPISMVPAATRNALYALFIPLATLILAVQIGRERRFQILIVFISVGLASGLLGMLQVVSAPDGPLYFYDVTNNGSAVGLFSNRNHQAMWLACLFPMLAVFACAGVNSFDQSRLRLGLSIAAGAVLVPLPWGSQNQVLTPI